MMDFVEQLDRSYFSFDSLAKAREYATEHVHDNSRAHCLIVEAGSRYYVVFTSEPYWRIKFERPSVSRVVDHASIVSLVREIHAGSYKPVRVMTWDSDCASHETMPLLMRRY